MKKLEIVMLHGWSWENYSKFGNSDPWKNRSNFICALKKNFNVHTVIFPGFCGIAEPRKAWRLDDFAGYTKNYLKENNIYPDIVLGYSFGAAVAVRLKSRFNLNCPIILVSPAIIRATSNVNITLGFWKKIIPEFLTNWLREIYLCHIVKNPFHKHGSNFLRKSYQKIVRIDLSSELFGFSPEDFVCIFGSADTATPPNHLLEKLGDNAAINSIKIINEGGHDIANTHTNELLNLINNFLYENKEGK